MYPYWIDDNPVTPFMKEHPRDRVPTYFITSEGIWKFGDPCSAKIWEKTIPWPGLDKLPGYTFANVSA